MFERSEIKGLIFDCYGTLIDIDTDEKINSLSIVGIVKSKIKLY